MKQLLTLISLFFVLSVNSQTITYTIKQGDTLYSIAKDNQISINKIFKVNGELGFSPNNIYAGNKIFLPYSEENKIDQICISNLGLIQYHPYKPLEEIVNKCLSELSKFINPETINYQNLTNNEILYLINSIYKKLSFDDDSTETWQSFWLANSQEEYQILKDAAEYGNIKAAYSANYVLPKNFNDYIKDQSFLSILNNDSLLSLKKECNLLSSSPIYNDYDLLMFFYSECATLLFDANDNDYIKFDNLTADLILSNSSEIIKYYELSDIVNIAYRRLNSKDPKGAFDIIRNYISHKCESCESAIDFYNQYADAKELSIGSSYYNTYLLDSLYTLILNDSSAEYTLKVTEPEAIIEDRQEIFSILRKQIKNDSEDFYGYKNTYANFVSDTALKSIRFGECGLASIYLDIALDFYQSENWDNSNLDYFIEPLLLASCYLNNAAHPPKSFSTDDIFKSFDQANYYYQIAYSAKDELNIDNPIKLSLLNIVNLMIELIDFINTNDKNPEDTDLPIKLKNKIINLSTILKQKQIYDFAGDIEEYEILTNFYITLYQTLDDSGWIDVKTLMDPISLLQMKDNFFVNSKLINLKVENTNLLLQELQNKLIQSNSKIKSISDDESLNYNDMLQLYKNNSELIEKILALDKNLNEYAAPHVDTVESIQSSLKENEYAYFYVPSSLFSKIILLSSDDFIYWDISGGNLIKYIIKEFKSNIDPNKNYDFELAKFIGDNLFPMFNEVHDFVEKESTIYIYTDNLLGLPPGILVKSYNESDEISEYERLISAEWFIKDYNFTTKLNYANEVEKPSEKKPFLGIGNSTSYNWVGLPNLKEVNSEITNLALSSFAQKDDILLNQEATKEFFLDKLKNNYERVVISTHSVPPNWQGLIEEPALVFNSKVGDYFLTPSEIINKNFNSDIVVLSSCNASIDGFDDLYKSFLIAGSNSVVHSNWNLESRYAKEFTTSFFKELWVNDKNKHEAIRNVSLKFLNDYSQQAYAHPAYWGNFSIVYSSLN